MNRVITLTDGNNEQLAILVTSAKPQLFLWQGYSLDGFERCEEGWRSQDKVYRYGESVWLIKDNKLTAMNFEDSDAHVLLSNGTMPLSKWDPEQNAIKPDFTHIKSIPKELLERCETFEDLRSLVCM